MLGKKTKKIGTVINTCVFLIKQNQKKMTEIPQKHDFLTWNTYKTKLEKDDRNSTKT